MILTQKQEQGLKIAVERYKKSSPGQGQYNYCPHCGAEMRKANE